MKEDLYLRFTPDHEILTERGWIFFNNLTINDKIAAMIKNVLEYVDLLDIKEYNFDGQLCKVESNQVSLLLTPSNGVYVGNYKGTDFKKNSIKIISGSVCKYLKSCENTNLYENTQSLQELIIEKNKLVKFRALSSDSREDEIVIPIDLWISICSIVLYSFILNEGKSNGDNKDNKDIQIVTKNPLIKKNLDKLVKFNLATSEEEDGNGNDNDNELLICYNITHPTLLKYLNFSKKNQENG